MGVAFAIDFLNLDHGYTAKKRYSSIPAIIWIMDYSTNTRRHVHTYHHPDQPDNDKPLCNENVLVLLFDDLYYRLPYLSKDSIS